ncbi:MAG: prolipoprotein diacylglyceryl transferase [Tepidiformaceae bacterium]
MVLAITIGIDPIAFSFGPVGVHWYGIGYAVAIAFGLWVIRPYATFRKVPIERFWDLVMWCIPAGFIGGRLFYVVQNHPYAYFTHPWRALQVWNGGMAFFGAIIAVALVLLFFTIKERWDLAPMLDVGALFALVGQPIGRLGNVVNGDILGPPTHLAWGFIYSNPRSFAPSTRIAYQPAAVYEIIANLALIAVLFPLRKRFAPGWLAASYLAGYCVTQLVVFHWRTQSILGFGLQQAQWTAIVLLLLEAVVLALWVSHGARPLVPKAPASEIPAQVS